jgi:hypothetical protein
MKLSYDSITISEPSLPPKKHRKRKEGEEEVLDEIGEEVKQLKEEAVVREKAMVEFKLTAKSGEQVKDQGINYLRWSLSSDTPNYLSYVRGKSNIVQVFDT